MERVFIPKPCHVNGLYGRRKILVVAGCAPSGCNPGHVKVSAYITARSLKALSGMVQRFLSVCKLHIHCASFFLLAANHLFVIEICCESRLGFQVTPWKGHQGDPVRTGTLWDTAGHPELQSQLWYWKEFLGVPR